MSTLKIVFANIYQGLLYEGKVGEKDIFSKYWPEAYAEQYAALNPDIICLAEAPMDDEDGNSRFVADFARQMGAVDYRTDVHAKVMASIRQALWQCYSEQIPTYGLPDR
jgi:hypothetical protein